MIPPIDPQTKQFYLEMGYSEQQIYQAFQCSKNTGIDFLDALAISQQASKTTSPAQPQAPPAAKNYKDQPSSLKSFSYKSNTTFLTPWRKIKTQDYEILYSRFNKHLHQSSKIQLREQSYPVGLLNVSNCCYLNSLLQCYYLMNSFKVAILTAEPLPNLDQALASESKTKIKRIKSQYDLLAQFKKFFTTMALTSKKYLDPSAVLQHLVDSVGEKVSYGEEKDLSEINILIIERLSEGLEHSKHHYQSPQQESLIDLDTSKQGSAIIHHQSKQQYNSIFNPRQGPIKKLFYGTKVEYYEDASLQKQQPIVSDFTGLIVHPRAGTLYKALDEQFNFEVEINGGLYRKSAFIRDEPEYLYVYINRTDFDRQEGQALKNQNKFHFDFSFYLDRYLQKYREEHNQSHERIKQLLDTKNKLKEQMNFLQILFKKVEQCQPYAQELEGWADRLPKEEEFQQEYQRLQQKLETIQKQLDQVESRKQQYHLMYIFVHRGDAVSGHYWGYGRNDDQWYRFDINTSQIQQDQIVIDLEKSSATPYALLYVKANNLPNFDYRLHLDTSVLKQKYPQTDFRSHYDPKIASQIISYNQQLYQESLNRSNSNVKSKTFAEYISRLTGINKVASRYESENKTNQHLLRVEIVNNFSLFLWSRKQHDLAKFTLFEQALLSASANKLTIDCLMKQTELLHRIQKKFKKSCLGENSLKFYSLLPKEVDKLAQLYQEYQICAFEVAWASLILQRAELYLDEWNSERVKYQETLFDPSANLQSQTISCLRLLKLRRGLYKDETFVAALKSLQNPLYISQINNEISKLLMLHIATSGLKIDSLQGFIGLQDQIGAQIATINAANTYGLELKSLINDKTHPVQQAIDLFQPPAPRNSIKRQSQPQSSGNTESYRQPSTKSGFKNSFLTSPSKNIRSISQGGPKEEKAQSLLITRHKSILTLKRKQLWKVQELQKMKINYGIGAKLLTFLKKLGPVPKVYKRLIANNKPFSLSELREEGIFLNQPGTTVLIQESLI